MQFVEITIIKLYAHAYQIILDVHQIVDPNALWIRIVQQRWLVFVINARVRAMAPVVQMRIAQFCITKRIVFVMMVLLVIHTVDAAKLFSVSEFDRIALKSVCVSLMSLYFSVFGF